MLFSVEVDLVQIVMCLLVTKAPTSNLATSCLEELDTVEGLFELAAIDSRPASNSLVSMEKIFEYSPYLL